MDSIRELEKKDIFDGGNVVLAADSMQEAWWCTDPHVVLPIEKYQVQTLASVISQEVKMF